MAKYRENPCKFYIAFGECTKGRQACHKGLCQHCTKYVPRTKTRHINRKKQYLEKIKKKEFV